MIEKELHAEAMETYSEIEKILYLNGCEWVDIPREKALECIIKTNRFNTTEKYRKALRKMVAKTKE